MTYGGHTIEELVDAFEQAVRAEEQGHGRKRHTGHMHADRIKTEAARRALLERVKKLEAGLRKIMEPITIAADPETVVACQDLHELICDIADRVLQEA